MFPLSSRIVALFAVIFAVPLVGIGAALACNGHAHQRPEKPSYQVVTGHLLVHNPNSGAVELLLDGKEVGIIDAGKYATFGPFVAGDHRIVLRIPQRRLESRRTLAKEVVTVRPFARSQLNIPLFARAVVSIKNTSRRDVQVMVNGKSRGLLEANSKLKFMARKGAEIELLGRRGRLLKSQRVEATGLSREGIRFDGPERASMRIFNAERRTAKLFVDGRYLGKIGGGNQGTFMLPVGIVDLEVEFGGRGNIDRRVFEAVKVAPYGIGFFELRTRGDGRGGARRDAVESRSRYQPTASKRGSTRSEASVDTQASS